MKFIRFLWEKGRSFASIFLDLFCFVLCAAPTWASSQGPLPLTDFLLGAALLFCVTVLTRFLLGVYRSATDGEPAFFLRLMLSDLFGCAVMSILSLSGIIQFAIRDIILMQLLFLCLSLLFRFLADLPKKTKTPDPSPNFQIEELLFRPSVQIEGERIAQYYENTTVLVTGGGGSIGSELCRQIARCKPKHLIILDIYENNAYEIQQELLAQYGEDLPLTVEIASVRDRERLDRIFAVYRPDIVFHAAAHKHVPLMEHNGEEAVKNNILGTYHTADMAERYGVRKFILISTDKAVNPTSLMGASKRMCEMIMQSRSDSQTSFAAVRFGNVLGSNGSVIPLFKKQIAAGGPITLTDKRMTRYFMTISEAGQLVMQAGAMANRGELFVLDMGTPVRIYDLAVNMIKLSGLEPHRDIEIKEVGLRPGEKLYEELQTESESVKRTDHHRIFAEQATPLSREAIDAGIKILTDVLAQENPSSSAFRAAFKQIIPTFRDAAEYNRDMASPE